MNRRTSFGQLPDEIVLKIATFLDPQSVKNFALTCVRFANITQSSSKLLKNFKLKLDAVFWENKKNIEELLATGRNITNLELSEIDGRHNVLNALFTRFGPQVEKLKISKSTLDDFTFKEILRVCVSLKELLLIEVTIDKKLPMITAVRNGSLKTLFIQYCDWEIFKFFTKTQLFSLTVKSYLDESNRKSLVDLLSCQYRLKELILHGTALRRLFQDKDIVCNFFLITFRSVSDIGKNSESVNWNVTDFLHQHEETLRNIEISGPHNTLISSYVLSNFINLHSLVLDVRGLPKDEIFYEIIQNQPPNLLLQDLKLHGFFFQQENVKKILLKYPSIKNLEINDWGNESLSDMLTFVSQNFACLENLSITEISSSNVKFPTLKKLNVNYIRNSRKLMSFIIENAGIEILKIGIVSVSQTHNLIQELKALHHIKYLSIGGNKTALRAILNNLMLTRDLPNELKTLELSVLGENSDDGKKYLQLHLPFNPSCLKSKYQVLA